MWSSKIAHRILDYFSVYYAKKERAAFSFDLSNLTVGGSAGLSLLLTGDTKPADIIEIYDNEPLRRARQIADGFYAKTGIQLVFVETIIENREFDIKVGTRLIAKVLEEATTNIAPVPFTMSEKETTFKLVAPNLQLIKVLRDYSDPTMFDDRDDNRELIKQLVQKIRELNPKLLEPSKTQLRDGTQTLNSVDPRIRSHLLSCVHIVSTPQQAIYVTDMNTQEFVDKIAKDIGGEVKTYEVLLPNEFFLNKVIVRIKIHRAANGGDNHGHQGMDAAAVLATGVGLNAAELALATVTHQPALAAVAALPMVGGGDIAPDTSYGDSEDDQGDITGGDYFMRLVFYTEGFYELIGFNTVGGIRQAIPSVVMRYMLIEDNASVSLFKRGHGDFAVQLMNNQVINDTIEEVFPQVSQFYGYYRNKSTLKKTLRKSSKRHAEYFPVVSNIQKDIPPTEEE